MHIARRHKNVLRGAAFVTGLVMFVSSLQSVPVKEETYASATYLANVVGVFAGVPENPINTKAAQLAAKEAELNAREAALNPRPLEPARSPYADFMSFASLALSSLVLLLVVLNFYFDHRHALEERRGPLVTR